MPVAQPEMMGDFKNYYRGRKMPLKEGTSDKTRNENIGREIAAGKDPKQAAAIGYSVQREAKKKHRAPRLPWGKK